MSELTYRKIECKGCIEGIGFCKNRPCWGTVKDFEKIIDAGHAHSLMLDFWGSDATISHNVEVLCGAIEGNQGKHVPFNAKGACVFLKDDLCSIHEIKPSEGAADCCKNPHGRIRPELAKDWDSDSGRALVKRWRDIVGLHTERDIKEDFVGGLTMMLEMLEQYRPKNDGTDSGK